ncbi:MAG: PspA/IM30 family protein [Chloroflexota bacterium]
MASIMDKVKTLLKASFHDMIDKALKSNPIKTLNQYLREHEEALAEMQSDRAVALGSLKTANRKVIEAQDLIERIESEIEAILTDDDATNDYLAENLAEDLIGQEEKLKVLLQARESAMRVNTALQKAEAKMQGRIISLKNQIELLKAIKFEADIKQMSADKLINSARMISSGTTSVEAIAEDIKRDRDKADAKFEVAMDTMDSKLEDHSRQSRASSRLAQIRNRLGIEEAEQADVIEPSLEMTEEELSLLDGV